MDRRGPEPQVAERQFRGIILDGADLYTAAEIGGFSKMWQILVAVGNALREILSTRENKSPAQTKEIETQICQQPEPERTLLLTVVSRQLRLHQNSALSALYRLSEGRKKLEAVTADTTSIIHVCLDDATSAYMAPTTIPLIVPAMLVQLRSLKSTELDTRKQGGDTLEIYSRFLTAIEDSYPAASIVKRLFATAQDLIIRNDLVTPQEDPSPDMLDPLVSLTFDRQLDRDHFPELGSSAKFTEMWLSTSQSRPTISTERG